MALCAAMPPILAAAATLPPAGAARSARVDAGVSWPSRPIGMTVRKGWLPTQAQGRLVDHLRAVAAAMPAPTDRPALGD